MHEYFITTNSFAAPWFSDMGKEFVKANTPTEALERVVKKYSHPCGLYAAMCYQSSDDYHKNGKPLAKWLCNHELAKWKATKKMGSYSFRSNGPGDFEINGKKFLVKNPKGGKIVK